MNFWGKILGGIFGWILFSPLHLGFIGAILGIWLGHNFDKALNQNIFAQVFGLNREQLNKTQQIFFKATFSIMGHIAKADGRVLEQDIQAARQVMSQLGLNEEQKLQAIEYYNMGKQAQFDLSASLQELKAATFAQKILLKVFIDIQLQAAAIGGKISQNKLQIIQRICQTLGFAPIEFTNFEETFRAEQAYRRNYQSYSQPKTHRPSLDDAYKLLGVNKEASAAEIKKAYRRLMSQNHPDKLVAKGLPEAMIKLATEKTQEIQLAYEQIKEAKGF